MNKDLVDLLFRIFFSLIFLALGAEHMLSDGLIQKLMPHWMPAPDIISILVGIILSVGGICIVLGWQLRFAAVLLGSFVFAVTLAVHLPALFIKPDFVSPENHWMWDILQRSNLAKNVCLLGVCFLLWHYQPGKWSVQRLLREKQK
ncbi:MAG: DoxX family protein [Verrucomicrobiae bacterium]|nr:DoxX family protein [Verrucomicrobiae bacterium]